MPRQSSRPPSHLSRHPVALTALAVVLALGPTACGSDDDASPRSTTSGPPATTLEPDATAGSTVPAPRALLESGALSGSAGSVLDPIVAIRCSLTLEPGQMVALDLVTGAAPSRG